MSVASDFPDAGCPSGLAPPTDAKASDPSPFVKKADGDYSLDLIIRGATCAGCLNKIETAIHKLAGVHKARLNLSTGQMQVRWTGSLQAQAITETISQLGYGVSAQDIDEHDSTAQKEERGLLLALGVAGFAAANIMLLSVSVWAGAFEMGEATRKILHALSGAIAFPVILFSGRPFFKSAWAVLKNGHANMDVPISLAVILAFSVSVWETFTGGEHAYFDASVMLLFFLLIGRYLDARLRRRAHAAAHELAALRSATATRIDAAGNAQSVKASQVRVGDKILIAPGERAVVDVEVLSGQSDVDESLVTGESLPRVLGPGAKLYSGSVVLGNALTCHVIAEASDSLMADIAQMLEAGEQRKSAYRKIADKAVALYVPLVHSLALLTFIGWLMAGIGAQQAIMIAVSALIITCPCALALAAPVAQVVASSKLYKTGVFLKSGDALERLSTADHIVFDKTGTLTLGHPKLISAGLEEDQLHIAASLARASRHPLSRGLVMAAGPGSVAENVTEFPGLGLEGQIQGKTYRLGSASWTGIEDARPDGPSLYLVSEGTAPTLFQFFDEPRDGAKTLIETLGHRGISVEIVSGDTEVAVAKTASVLGIKEWTANAKPQDKIDRLEALQADGRKVLMIGDGLNDAGALALAHASLAPGGAMDVSQSASDAVYSGESLDAITAILDISKRARKTMLQNFALAAAYNMIAIPVAVLGYVTPLIAAIAMSASSLIVTLNALRQNLNTEHKK